jgi:valyl-tRNA synthetase
MLNIPTTYDQSKESELYKLWESSGYFNPDNLTGKPFTIIMPPPNANGKLHLGHVVFVTPEDIMIRFQRMQGRKTLWLPGTDHAGFETQVVFEKQLEKAGRSRFQMTREKFYKEAWDFVQENKQLTEEGIKSLGASADWSRNMFTLDPKVVNIVHETFAKMYADGLIYRGNRICNWCPKHQTGLSDLETEYEERTDPLYYIKYGPFTLATVRPETKFGDTALAVNPKDKRYKKYVGQEVEAEGLLGKFKIKIIADDLVDKDFGTGVVKVTPAHDAVDFEIWQKHKDEIPGPKQVIDKRGKMDLPGTKYHGLKVAEARKLVAQDLQTAGLMEKIDEHYKHNISLCYKCKNMIEPLIIPQWYVAMTKKIMNHESGIMNQALRDIAVEAVKTKKIKFIPARFEKVFMHWMNNIRDWPISRQIWWGIPIPVWYKGEEIKISPTSPGDGWVQDPDTFDTWFSSGQWPYAALKANSDKDLAKFYPTDVMETGWEILFFWVARMIMFGLYLTDQIPFHTVYLHGILRE